MPRIYSKTVSGTQLITGVLGTVDYGNIVAQVVNFTQDVDKAKEEFQRVKAITQVLAENTPSWIMDFARKDAESLVKDASSKLKVYFSQINDEVWNQLVASAGGFKITSSLIGHKIKLMNQNLTLDMWSELAYGIPLQKIEEKAERYYNKILAPYYPSERDAFQLYRLGKWDKAKFVNMLRETLGITATDAENITEIREWQIGKPSLRDAWYFVQKGYKDKQYFYDLAQKGFGFTKEDADALFKHYSYDPSFSELLRLSDLIPLESSWIDKKLTALGLDSEDKPIFKSAIEKRVIRDEINKAWSYILDAYQWGLFTEKDITDLLTNWNFTQEEIKIRIQTGELLKTKLRLKLLRDAEIYLYRKGVITETDLLTRLVNLGISKDIANAIVRNEAAKKGIEWEIPSE